MLSNTVEDIDIQKIESSIPGIVGIFHVLTIIFPVKILLYFFVLWSVVNSW